VRAGWINARAAGYSCYSLQPGHLSSLPAPNFQPTATQQRDEQCGNQHYSRELLMMGITVPGTRSAYHQYNKTISSIYSALILLLKQGTIQYTLNINICAEQTRTKT